MTAPTRPPLKSLARAVHRPHTAQPATPAETVGGPKDVGRRPSSLRSDPQQGDGRFPIAWLHVTAPGRGAVPTATSKCLCGHDRSAVGHRKVLALIDAHTHHRDVCPLRTTERRNAA
ncbi:hypothetical protein [Streptomyces macrosporus]|uniref:Uncharacterized protein n=1 Tax=Streptomyces macrosporus TaxID=44032 RepID=A0ABN3KQA0_9ACTN